MPKHKIRQPWHSWASVTDFGYVIAWRKITRHLSFIGHPDWLPITSSTVHTEEPVLHRSHPMPRAILSDPRYVRPR